MFCLRFLPSFLSLFSSLGAVVRLDYYLFRKLGWVVVAGMDLSKSSWVRRSISAFLLGGVVDGSFSCAVARFFTDHGVGKGRVIILEVRDEAVTGLLLFTYMYVVEMGWVFEFYQSLALSLSLSLLGSKTLVFKCLRPTDYARTRLVHQHPPSAPSLASSKVIRKIFRVVVFVCGTQPGAHEEVLDYAFRCFSRCCQTRTD